MKKIFKIFIAVFILTYSCKKPNNPVCEGENCPLSDGSYCLGNLINVNNNCVCPERNIMLNDSLCFSNESSTVFTSFYNIIECGCISGDFFLGYEILGNGNLSGVFSL